MNLKNNNEELVWQSIDSLIEEVKEVFKIGLEIVSFWDLAEYTFFMMWTALKQTYREAKDVLL